MLATFPLLSSDNRGSLRSTCGKKLPVKRKHWMEDWWRIESERLAELKELTIEEAIHIDQPLASDSLVVE